MTRPESAAEVFDALGTDYEHAFRNLAEQRAALTALAERLPAGARVLDLGSGTGRPVAEQLAAAGCAVTGYDVAPKMVEIARAQAPAARFELGDMRELSFEDGSWDAITAFFSMLQLPRADQETMIGRLARWLKPGGLLVFATVPADVDGVDIVFMGHPVRASSFAADALAERLRAAGLEIVREEQALFVPDHPDAGPEPHVYLTARKPA
ncbi:methyltransferase domain-containing protein [Amycolatopsis sp. FBCC-B4732]|uniref:class I SAM-dependent methyltransferase n=1 Tax=Amycolatopsis sp. FBCC-B4732 TaxID=3079339 RepID=UPI001FF5C285|nr:methyltransferase domain-containing protein [Amycolatopsis sp. FBCC-B4732]UOX89102.1 methyltransferase domain-containing protein [Amycolatopsis sp. FBCC-B4732]